MERREPSEPQEIFCPERFPLRPGVGCLVIVGGAGTPQVVYDEFFRLAGGRSARVLHVPSATQHFAELTDRRAYYDEFYSQNPESFDFLHTYERAEAERPEFAAPLAGATGVWVGGGNQNVLTDLFLGTEVLRGIHDVVERGGVVGGTSSGCAIMSETMICRGYVEIDFGPGFGLYPRTIVDSHFSGRERHRRVARAALLLPDHVAIGIDERSALVVQGERLGVIGREGRCVWYHFADVSRGVVRRYRLWPGETVDVGAPVRGADQALLEAAIREGRTAEVLTAEWMAEAE
jgi:cyanophycinase